MVHASPAPAVPSRWAPYVPTPAAPWNLPRVVHLHRRAGFAATRPELQRDLREGPDAAIERVLAGTSREDIPGSSAALSHSIADAAMASENPARLQAWWLYQMLTTRDSLGERLALMWHNHFATSNRKVQNLVLMREQNDLFRKHARGHFGDLLAAVVKHPAMLVWLDADTNRKGKPNENLARELMELFTLGIGHYSEDDIRETARALTGWAVVENRFEFRAARHDDGEKQVLGTAGRLDGDGVLRIVLNHPATARRLAERLMRTYLGETVDEAALQELADGMAARNLDVGWGIATILRSARFFAAENLRSRVLGPIEYVVGALRALELCNPLPSTLALAEWTGRMGQELFYPPNVGGWREGRGWLTSRAIVARANFAQSLAHGSLWSTDNAPALAELCRRYCGSSELDECTAWLAELLWGEAEPGIVKEIAAAARAVKTTPPLTSAVMMLLTRPEHYLA